MIKNIFVFCLIFYILSACTTNDIKIQNCPSVNIPRDVTRQYISAANFDAFQITLSGKESYCYTDEISSQRYAVITPIFRVRRLEDSPDSVINTSVYIKPIGEKKYLDKQVKAQTLRIPVDQKEQTIKGNPIKLRIPQPPYDDFSIEMGLNLSDYAYSKSKSMFDIDYKYLSDEDLNAHEEKINMEFLEIGPDERVVFCKQEGRPVVVKKGSDYKNCD